MGKSTRQSRHLILQWDPGFSDMEYKIPIDFHFAHKLKGVLTFYSAELSQVIWILNIKQASFEETRCQCLLDNLHKGAEELCDSR